MKHYPVVLSIAGSDCSGGAGIQADIKTISALGGYAASAVTAVTVQNTTGICGVHTIPAEVIRGQIEAVMQDLRPEAVKIGMVDELITVRVIADCLRKYTPEHVVYDPVMVSSSGRKLMSDEAMRAIRQELFPLATLITPNLDEVAAITGQCPANPEQMQVAARTLSEFYGTAVLVKGGHLEGGEMLDILWENGNSYIYKEKKIVSKNLHGTGCTLSSAIATFLAFGYTMDKAVYEAKTYLSNAIEAGKEVTTGHGDGPLCHFWNPQKARIVEVVL